MGLWAPFVTHAMTRGNTLGPYSVAVFLTLGALLSCSIWNVYFMKHPLVGEPVSFGGFFSAAPSGHLLGILSGRRDLGHWHGLQSGRRKLHGCSDLVRNRPVGADGCGIVGRAGMERIRRRWSSRQGLSDDDVRLLLPGDSIGSKSQRLKALEDGGLG